MRSLMSLLVLTFGLAACGASPWITTPAQSSPTAASPVDTVTPVRELPTQTTIPTTAQTDSPTPAHTATATELAPVLETPPPASLSIEDLRATTAAELIEVIPPIRDEIGLAVAYLGVNPVAATPQPISNLPVGTIENFYINNVDSNTIHLIEAELMSVGENAYFWFDTGDGSISPVADDLAAVTAAFDVIFDTLHPYSGVPTVIDGRVHIVHASPSILCDIPNQCSLAGYFSSRDLLPRAVDPQSNEREMFVMNARHFESSTYLDTLSHELRHLLGNSTDLGEEDWFVEGAAMLTEDLVGFTMVPQFRANQFLANPDLQLTSWQDENTGPRYGQGYLVNRFLYDRLGVDLYREYTRSPKIGLQAVDEVAEAHDLDVTGNGLWLDWLAAMALHDAPDVPEPYRWQGPPLGMLATIMVDNVPANLDETVNQYAADYFELPSSSSAAVDFTGALAVSLLGSAAPSGDYIWYAQRANTSNPRLTRTVDLRDVDESTLRYKVYIDIEQGYDFAYVSASTDGGRTWRGLVAEGMQGLDTADDPSDTALTDRFYTGRAGRWIEESIDLSPFAGQEISLRFEYVTDLILTYGGFALDDIAIAEIGFFDDGETLDSGWTAEGFTRATADLPQSWLLQLITFDSDGRPSVERLSTSEDGRVQFTYQALPGVGRPILIVAAIAPETLQPAGYTLAIDSQ